MQVVSGIHDTVNANAVLLRKFSDHFSYDVIVFKKGLRPSRAVASEHKMHRFFVARGRYWREARLVRFPGEKARCSFGNP